MVIKVLTICLTLLVLGVLVAIVSVDFVTGFMLVLMAVGALFMSLIPAMTNPRYMWVEPPTVFAISIFIGYYCKTLYVLGGYGSNPIVTSTLMLNEHPSELLYGGLLLTLGITCLITGYQLQKGKFTVPVRVREYSISRRKVLTWSAIFIAIGYFFFILFASGFSVSLSNPESLSAKRFKGVGVTPSDRLSSSSYLYYRISQVAKAPLYVLFFLIVAKQARLASPVGLLFLLSAFHMFALAIFTSNKSDVLITAFDLVLIGYLVMGRLLSLRVYVLGAIALYSMSLVASIRSRGAFDSYSFFDKIFANRYFFEITKSSHIINSVPGQVEYAFGQSFVAWMNLFLPKSVEFSNDYFTNMGFYLARNVFGLFNSGVPPGIVAELYMNFSLVGVVAGMFLYGMLLRVMHRTLAAHFNSPFIVVVYVLIMIRFSAFLINNSFNVAMLKSCGDSILVVLFLLLVGESGKQLKARRRHVRRRRSVVAR